MNQIILDEITELENSLDNTINQEINLSPKVINSFKIKDTLNPKIWSNDKIIPEIKNKLILIAKNFIKELNLDKKIHINDIIFTGSVANYNWSDYSDIDLHIVLNFNQFNAEPKLIEKFFNTQKTLWNLNHNITIKDFPVEIYVQNTNEVLIATAVYSLLHDKWIKKPKKVIPNIDKNLLKNKTITLINKLRDIKNDYNNENYQDAISKAKFIKDKLKKLRKIGLHNNGEFSNENLLYKIIRRIPFMDVLNSIYIKAYDKLMSINENNNQFIEDGVVLIKGPKLPNGKHNLFITQTKTINLLDRYKKDNSKGQPSKMVTFGNNQVFKLQLMNDKLKPLSVAWNSKDSMLKNMGLTKTSLTLNSNTKTPLHWETLRYNNINQALTNLKDQIIALNDVNL
jgi:predicted nucleotidyltransferase